VWSVAVSAAVCAVLVFLPRIAAACPYGAANDDSGNATSRVILLGGFILLPFAVAGVAIYAVVRAVRRARAAEQSAQRHPGDW
jgi:hypothetical protein